MPGPELVAELSHWEELSSEVDKAANEIGDLVDRVQECGNRIEELASELDDLLQEFKEKIRECEESAEALRSAVATFCDWAAEELPERAETTCNRVVSKAGELRELYGSKLNQEFSEHIEKLADDGREISQRFTEGVRRLGGQLENNVEERRKHVQDWYEQTKNETMGRLENLDHFFMQVGDEFERTGRNITRIMEMKDFAIAETNVAMSACADVADLVRSTIEEVV